MLEVYAHSIELAQDRRVAFLKEAEHEALLKLAKQTNSDRGKEYHRTGELSLRQRLSLLFF